MTKSDFDMNALPVWLQDVATELAPLNDYRAVAQLCGMSKGSLANICSEGAGPSGAVVIAKRKLFPKRSVLQWMLARAEANAVTES